MRSASCQWLILVSFAASFSAALAEMGSRARAEDPPPVDGAFRPAVAAAQARTVKIYGASIGRTPGYASGILVSSKGEIVTALGSHLSGGLLRVTLASGESYEAQVVRRSQDLQLALLKIAANTPEFFTLGDKPAVENGDWLIAVSNAFKVAEGKEQLSVNVGVLSTRLRLDARRGYLDFPYDNDVYLYDAITSNPGAGGGAVVDIDGQLVGMIGRVIESKTTGTRLNYAVPADLVLRFVEGREAPTPAAAPTPSMAKVDLGIRMFGLGGRKSPAYVDRVLPGSPAAQAGVKADDLILSINGEAIRDAGDFARVGALVSVGELTLEVKRKNEVLQLRGQALGPVANPAAP